MPGLSAMKGRTVLPQITAPDEARFHALLVQGLARVSAKHGRGQLADAMGRSGRQLDNVFGGADPKAKALFDALLLDPTALDEVAAAYGLRIVPATDGQENDMRLAAGIAAGLAKLIESNADGVRDHNETLAIAAVMRPHLGALTNIINQADEITRPRH
jgi:hypothetical protein